MTNQKAKTSLRVVVLGALILGGAVGATVAEELSVADGARLYNDNCARCHNPKPAEDYSAMEWSVIMPHMREKAHLTGTETRAIERFLAATLTADVQQSRASAGESVESQASGEQLFNQFGCQGCHQVDGVGGTMGPDLNKTYSAKGADFMVQKMLNPALGNPSSTMPKFPLSETEATRIAEYIGQ